MVTHCNMAFMVHPTGVSNSGHFNGIAWLTGDFGARLSVRLRSRLANLFGAVSALMPRYRARNGGQ